MKERKSCVAGDLEEGHSQRPEPEYSKDDNLIQKNKLFCHSTNQFNNQEATMTNGIPKKAMTFQSLKKT